MAFLDFLLGKGEKTQQFQRFSPQQQGALNQLLGGAQKQLPQGFEFLSTLLSQDPEQMAAFERPALRQFEEQILPSIAERFTGMFGTGSHRSSAFGQQLGSAGARLAENLQAQRSGLGLGALSQLQGLLGAGLQPQTESVLRPGQPGFLQNIAGGGGNLGLLKLFGLI